MDEYIFVSFKNDSSDTATVFFYPNFDPLCLNSLFLKTIKPRERYSHKGDYKFKYQIKFNGNQLTKVKTMSKNMVITIDACVDEKDLNDDMILKTLVQHYNFVKSASVLGAKNLYTILGLDMEVIRRLPNDSKSFERKNALEDAYNYISRKYCPEEPGGNSEIMKEIVSAYKTLNNQVEREKYHNEFDKNRKCLDERLFFSKLLFYVWPEAKCHLKVFKFSQIIISLVLVGLGIALSTGKFGVDQLKVDIYGLALYQAGSSGFFRSLKNICKWKHWLLSILIGGLFGALTGVIIVATSLKVVSIVGRGAIAGSIGGGLQSIGSVLEQYLLDDEIIEILQIIINCACSMGIGSLAGAAGGWFSGRWGGSIVNSNIDEYAEVAFFRNVAPKCMKFFITKLVELLFDLPKRR